MKKILVLKTRVQMQSTQLAEARSRADALVSAARQRLTLSDLPEEDIEALDTRREPHDAVTFRSPVNGIVMDKQAIKGAHVIAGQMLYRIADLSVVWVEADVYEAEMRLVRVGGRATVTLDAYPGERFAG